MARCLRRQPAKWPPAPCKYSRAGITLAVTGIAGPDGGSPEKPVGLVWFGLALSGKAVVSEKRLFENKGRDFIRRETVKHALRMGSRRWTDGRWMRLSLPAHR